MPAKGYKFSFSPNYVKVHYFHYVLTFFSPINLKYIDIESAIKCYVTNVPRHCVVCQSVGSSFVCPFLRCACKLGLAFFRINNYEFIFSREELKHCVLVLGVKLFVLSRCLMPMHPSQLNLKLYSNYSMGLHDSNLCPESANALSVSSSRVEGVKYP